MRPLVAALVSAALVAPASLIAPLASVASAAESGTKGALEIEVFSFSSTDAVDEAAALTDAFKHAVISFPGIAIHAPDAKGHSLEALALIVGCDEPTTSTCAGKIAQEIKHEKFVYGAVKKGPGKKITATINYYDTGAIRTVAKTYDSGPVAKDGASPELKKIATEALKLLLAPSLRGKVTVTVKGPAAGSDGEIWNGEGRVGKVTAGSATLELPIGRYALELRVPGFAPSVQEIELGAEENAQVAFSPMRLGEEPQGGMSGRTRGGIIVAAVGVGFLVGGVASSLAIRSKQDDETFTTYRRRWPTSEKDTCARAAEGREFPNPNTPVTNRIAPQVDSLCGQVSTLTVLQYAFYGLGIVGVGTGAYLILTDSSEPSDSSKGEAKTGGLRLQLRPDGGPGGGGLTLVGSF